MDGSLRRLRESLQAGLEAALSDLAPLVRELERERTRIAWLGRITVPARIESITVLVLLMLGAPAVVAFVVLFLVEWVLLGRPDAALSSERFVDLWAGLWVILVASTVALWAVLVILDWVLRRKPFFVRYEGEFLPRLAKALGLQYEFRPVVARFEDLEALGARFAGWLLRLVATQSLTWRPVFVAGEDRSVEVLGLEVDYRGHRGIHKTVFRGVVAVARLPEGSADARGAHPARTSHRRAPVVVRTGGRVYAFVPCKVDLLTPDPTVPLPGRGLDRIRVWFRAAAQAVELLSRFEARGDPSQPA